MPASLPRESTRGGGQARAKSRSIMVVMSTYTIDKVNKGQESLPRPFPPVKRPRPRRAEHPAMYSEGAAAGWARPHERAAAVADRRPPDAQRRQRHVSAVDLAAAGLSSRANVTRLEHANTCSHAAGTRQEISGAPRKNEVGRRYRYMEALPQLVTAIVAAGGALGGIPGLLLLKAQWRPRRGPSQTRRAARRCEREIVGAGDEPPGGLPSGRPSRSLRFGLLPSRSGCAPLSGR